MHPVEIKFTFTSMADAIAFMAAHNAKTDPLPVIEEQSAPKSAQAPAPAAGQATAKAGAAPKKTVAESAPAAASVVAEPQASTAATEVGNAAAVSSPPETAAASPASSSEAIEYPVLQKAVFALAGKSREAASSVAQSFGVKTFKELDASKWGDALAAVNAKLAEV